MFQHFTQSQVSKLHDRFESLLDQMFESLQAKTVHIDLAFAVDDLLRKRLPDRRRVFESMA
jgi:hypothetical protein